MTNKSPLMPLVHQYIEHDSAAAANTLEKMTEEEAAEVLRFLPPALSVRVVTHLQVGYIAAILKQVDAETFQRIASSLEPRIAATVFMHVPEDLRERLLENLSEKLKSEVREFLTYPEDSVGRIMGTDYLSFSPEISVRDAIKKIRILARKRFPASYVYVVDDEKHIKGVMNMRDLMLAAPNQTLGEIMRKDVFSIHCFTGREEAAVELSKRRFFAAPIVDTENRILGIIKAERLIQGIQEDVTEDIQKMVGAGGDERVFSSIGYSMKKRLPWLHVNLATAFLAAGVVAMFEGIIAKLTFLAIFLPVIAGQGGNAGAQSLAVVMRGLVMREIPKNKVITMIIKEGKLGAVNGAVIGAVTALVAWAWNGNPWFGLVIGLGMLLNLFFAGLSGASIPILMKKIGMDPAQCSSIILTTVTDIIGFLAFLGLAVLFQSRLV